MSSDAPLYSCTFEATLFRVPGKGGWVFAPVPEEHAPTVTLGWGRTPVRATVDGASWDTSVWTERSGRILLGVPRLGVPRKVRGDKDDGDVVAVRLSYHARYRS